MAGPNASRVFAASSRVGFLYFLSFFLSETCIEHAHDNTRRRMAKNGGSWQLLCVCVSMRVCEREV